jgi:MerC mercury resistance protein
MHKSMLIHSHRRQTRLTSLADSVGAVGAGLCAVHCALLPLLLALLPALGAGVLGNSSMEYGYVAFASALALSSLLQGYRRHRAYRAMAFLAPGLVAVWAGMLVSGLHEDVVLHAATMTLGGTLIATAHLVNLRLGHGHVHDAACSPTRSLDRNPHYGLDTP